MHQDMKSGQGLETWADGSTFKGEYRTGIEGVIVVVSSVNLNKDNSHEMKLAATSPCSCCRGSTAGP